MPNPALPDTFRVPDTFAFPVPVHREAGTELFWFYGPKEDTMACLKCGSPNELRELKGLALAVIQAERDPAIAPSGNLLPVSVFFCHCGFMELHAAQPRFFVEGEAIDLPRTNKP